MTSLRRLWRGELSLSDAFWIWAVFGGLAINVISSILFLTLILINRPILAFIIGYAPTLPFNVVVAIGVWRSADRYVGDRRWAELARIVTIIGMILLSVT